MMLPVSLEIVVQDRVVFVNGKAIHAQTVTSRFLSQRQDCDTVRSGVGAQRSGLEVTIADSLALFPSHRTNGRASVRSWCKNLGWHAQRPHQNREQVSLGVWICNSGSQSSIVQSTQISSRGQELDTLYKDGRRPAGILMMSEPYDGFHAQGRTLTGGLLRGGTHTRIGEQQYSVRILSWNLWHLRREKA